MSSFNSDFFSAIRNSEGKWEFNSDTVIKLNPPSQVIRPHEVYSFNDMRLLQRDLSDLSEDLQKLLERTGE
tara:strand:+ start:314 stop:526 length:213 start_codon:yes stop_codon:yes gene_type:complete